MDKNECKKVGCVECVSTSEYSTMCFFCRGHFCPKHIVKGMDNYGIDPTNVCYDCVTKVYIEFLESIEEKVFHSGIAAAEEDSAVIEIDASNPFYDIMKDYYELFYPLILELFSHELSFKGHNCGKKICILIKCTLEN